MVKITSDNPEVKAVLEKLCDNIERRGGYFAEDLEIVSKDGDLSVHARDKEGKGPIVRLPHECLIPFDAFELSIIDGHIDIITCKGSVTPVQRHFMEDMLELYRLTDKLKTHEQTCVWLAPENHKELLLQLTEGRNGGDIKLIKEQIDERERDSFKIKSFFKGRLLNCKLGRPDAPITNVLMPIVDCINHDIQARPFQNNYVKEDNPCLMVSRFTKEEGAECYACYGRYDALDSFIHYGFVDPNAHILRSVPVEIDLGSETGKICIKSLTQKVEKEEIPEPFQDLQFYMPVINVLPENREVQLSHIFIPSENAPRSMRRILVLALNMLKQGITKEEIQNHLPRIEEAILSANNDFYHKLENHVKEAGDKYNNYENELQSLIGLQLNKVNSYMNFRQQFA